MPSIRKSGSTGRSLTVISDDRPRPRPRRGSTRELHIVELSSRENRAKARWMSDNSGSRRPQGRRHPNRRFVDVFIPADPIESGTAHLPKGVECLGQAQERSPLPDTAARGASGHGGNIHKAPAGFTAPDGRYPLPPPNLGRGAADPVQALVELVSTRKSSLDLSAETSTSISSPFANSPSRIFSQSGSSM